MGLSPNQGHNNLRLYHTTPFHHNHRLDDTKHNLHILHKFQYRLNKRVSPPPCPERRHKKSNKLYAERPNYLSKEKIKPNLKTFHSDNNIFRFSQRYLRKSFPILSNLPFINRDASIILVNYSPFALRDPRFGIFHHCPQSISYFWPKCGVFVKSTKMIFGFQSEAPSTLGQRKSIEDIAPNGMKKI